MLKFSQIIKIFGITILFSFNAFAADNAVNDMLNQYLKNAKMGEITTVDNFISDDAEFIRINNIINKKNNHSKSDFLDIVKSGKFCNWASETNVKMVDVSGDIAVAHVEYKNSKLVQNEYLTLLFADNEWKIVNSVCSLSKK
jgi:hypothetical protein